MSDDEEETAKLRAMRRVAMRMDARGGAADAGTHSKDAHATVSDACTAEAWLVPPDREA